MLLITAPGSEPVDAATLRLHAKLDDAEPDALLNLYLSAARQFAEHHTGQLLMPQTWELALDAWPDAIEIPAAPVSAITSVKYFNASGADTTLASNQYQLDAYGLVTRLIPAANVTWPAVDGRTNGIRVRFVAGYASSDAVPQSIRHWILLRAAEAARHREAMVDGSISPLPWLDSLLDRDRIRWGC